MKRTLLSMTVVLLVGLGRAPGCAAEERAAKRADRYLRVAGGPHRLMSLPGREGEEYRAFLKRAGFNAGFSQAYTDLPVLLERPDSGKEFGVQQWRNAVGAGMETLPQVQVWGRLTEDGKRLRGGRFVTQDGREVMSARRIENCYNDPDFLRAGLDAMSVFCGGLARPGSGWLTQNGRYLLTTIDEASWGWRPDFANFVCYCPHCQAGFRAYVRDTVYRDATPDRDTDKDGHTLNRDCNTNWKTWDEVRIPFPGERDHGGQLDFKKQGGKPHLWYHFLNYRPRAAADFFARLKQEVNTRGVAMANMYWGGGEHPGFGALIGCKNDDHFRANDVICIEHGGADHPCQKLDFYRWEYLNRDARKPMQYWFHMYDHRADHDRRPYYRRGEYKGGQPRYASRHFARTLSHDFQGYLSYMANPESPDLWNEQAFWNHFIAAHEDFLLTSVPEHLKPERRRVAILFPWTAAMFHDPWKAPQKYDYEWGGLALMAYNYAVIPLSEEQVADGKALNDFDVLYLFGCDRVPWRVRREIEAFQKRGGWIWADAGSLSGDIAGADPKGFEAIFGTTISKTTKGPATLVMTTDALAPKGTTLVTHGTVTTVRPAAGVEVLATCGGEPVIVRRGRSFFVGTEAGKDVFCLCPRGGYVVSEPADEFGTDAVRAKSLCDVKPHIDVVALAARAAGVAPLVRVGRENLTALNIEAGVRQDPASGVRMIILKNSEPAIGGFYDLDVPGGGAATAWDLLAGEEIETPTDGTFRVYIPQQGVAIVVTGPAAAVADMVARQRKAVRENPPATVYECERWSALTEKPAGGE